MIATCPECGEMGVPQSYGRPRPKVVYGLLPPEGVEAAKADGYEIGGCALPDWPEPWRCPREHTWIDREKTTYARVFLEMEREGH